jgi:hypothetical protein
MPNPKSKLDIANAFAESSKASWGELQPFGYVNSLQYSLKNFRFELLTNNKDFQDATFFTSFVLHSLEIVKFITFSIALHIGNVTYPLEKKELASFALFQSKNWYLVSLLTKNSIQVNSKLFLEHISDIEEILSLWEAFILKNQIKCFQ